MRYIRKIDNKVEEYFGLKMGDKWYVDNGYFTYAGTNPVEYLDIVNGVVVELVIPEVEPNYIFTKVQVRTACKALNLEDKLNTLIDSSVDFKNFWADSLEVDLNHELTKQALQAGTFTDTEIQNVINMIGAN